MNARFPRKGAQTTQGVASASGRSKGRWEAYCEKWENSKAGDGTEQRGKRASRSRAGLPPCKVERVWQHLKVPTVPAKGSLSPGLGAEATLQGQRRLGSAFSTTLPSVLSSPREIIITFAADWLLSS